MSVHAVAVAGDRRATLVALRDKLAFEIDDAPSTVVAQLAGQLSKVLAELDGLAEPGKVSSLDELEKRRADRLATAEPAVPAGRPSRQRRSGGS